jgi:hypothetical protein
VEAKLIDLEYYGEIGIFTVYYSELLEIYVYIDKDTNEVMGCMKEEKR